MTTNCKKILLVAGARPNFMKIAPLLRVIDQSYFDRLRPIIVHTGQHYDYEMSQAFFEDLQIKRPDYFLGVGPGSHAVQTAMIMTAFEEVCLREIPDLVVVVGDVNSTLACALVAKKMGIRVAHVEAGLRSRDLTMPEEINRMVTDVLADYLFVSERSGLANLWQEGRPPEAIHFVGNVMVDTLYLQLASLEETHANRPEPYAVLTLHRPANVDVASKLLEIMDAVAVIARDLPVEFPAHPRTRQRLEALDLTAGLTGRGINLLPPLPYKTFLRLWKDAALVLTDSGGLQEETTALGVPCITIRDNTERPVTVAEGTNILAGTDYQGIITAYETFKSTGGKKGRVPELWDGQAAARIVAILAK
ncbi:MAG: UDP-N-acetylglucosamine 2-epimerase (non-hydrolyzing) [Deltaproteobacteria bacterium]|nr:MAG: UDP-N-acetylglucosamine 2-epimerase (non-hydrolyzing) [Deltaproteobacteria bacterium]